MPDNDPIDVTRRASRLWLIRGLLGVGIALALGFIALFAATRFLDPDQLASWLEPRMEAALDRDVSIGSARVDLFPPVAVALEEVTVGNPVGFEGAPLASVRELRLDLSVFQLFRRRVSVDEILIDRPEVRLVVRADGTSNAEGLGTGTAREGGAGVEPDAGGAPFQVAVESFRIDDGSLIWTHEGDGSAAVLAPLSSRFRIQSGDGGNWSLDGQASGRVGARTAGADGTRVGPYAVDAVVGGTASEGFRTIRLDQGNLTLEDLAFALTAEVSTDDAGGRTIAATLLGEELDASRLLSLVPDSLLATGPELAGRLSVDARLRAAPGTDLPPTLDATVSVAEMAIARAGMAPMVTSLAGQVFVTLDSVWTTDLEGVSAGGPVRVRGLLRNQEPAGFVVRVAAQPDLGEVAGMVTLPDSVTLAGGLALDVTAQGTLDDPVGAALSGRAEPEDVRFTLPGVGVPVGLPGGTVLLEGDVVRWRDLPVLLGEDRFSTSGQVTDVRPMLRGDGTVPNLDADFAGDRFDMDAVFPGQPPDSAVLYGKLLFAQLGERRIRDRTPQQILEERGLARPDSIPLAGDVRLRFGTFLSAPYALDDLRARVHITPHTIQVRDAEAGAYGGTVTASVDLGLGDSSEQPFSLQVEARGVQAGPFLGATSPLGRLFQGTLTLVLDVSGDMDDVYLPTRSSLLGSGSLQLHDGVLHAGGVTESVSRYLSVPQIRELRLSDWIAPVLIREGQVVLQESQIRGAFGEPRIAGSVGFGGQLALNLLFRLPSEGLDGQVAQRLGVAPEVLQRVRSRGVPLDAAIRIAGTVTDPELSADPGAVARGLADAVQAEVESEVQEALSERRQQLEDRAVEAVERLLPTPDTSRPGLPGLSDLRRLLTPNRSRPDTGRAARDTVSRPDSLATDTVPAPDTIRPDTTRSGT